MGRGIVSGGIAVVTVAAGAAIVEGSYERLRDEGSVGAHGLTGAPLDLTVGAVLLVGVTLLIAGVIVAIVALAQFLLDRQDAADAVSASGSGPTHEVSAKRR